jgi:membrane protease subunit (stomatin/prohibitin family)
MAIIDRIKFGGLGRDWLIYRYPGESFVFGTQLIVGEGQVAVFVKGGQALDYFTAGTYTLDTANIPLLKSIVNMPFGGKTPFTAEVYFINKTSKLDITWGTVDPIQVIDPKYNIKLRVRGFGQFGMKVSDYRVFLTELIGAMNENEVVNFAKILSFFKGVLVTKVKVLIAEAIITQKISVLEISAHIDEISEYSKQKISSEFDRFGLKVVNFYIQSINFPDEDFAEINQILKDKAAFDIIGDKRYVSKRSFDVLESAASNEGGTAGAFVGAGVGIGAGLSVGGAIGNVASSINTNASVQPVVGNLICSECGKANSATTKFCANCGKSLAHLTINCPQCGKENESTNKFCKECGRPISTEIVCNNCKTVNETGTKFCKDCGTKLEGQS